MTEDNRVALLDVGMVGHTSPGMQDKLLIKDRKKKRKFNGPEQ